VGRTCGTHEGGERCLQGRRRWEDNIEMNLTEIRVDEASWILLALDRVQWRASVNTVMNLRVP